MGISDSRGTAKDEGLEAREAALTQLVGEGDGGLIFLLLIGVIHILIVIIDIVVVIDVGVVIPVRWQILVGIPVATEIDLLLFVGGVLATLKWGVRAFPGCGLISNVTLRGVGILCRGGLP